MADLAGLVNRQVQVITNDGRVILGTLRGLDQTTNLILSSATERIFSLDEEVVFQDLGVYILRGDNIAIVGEIDQEKDKSISWNNVRADPIDPVRMGI